VNAVTDNRPDPIAAHFSRRVSDDPNVIFEQHSEPTVGQNLVNHSFDRKQLFFGHWARLLVR
jgi:hypothetical protein